jgi:hypothetical protein
MTVKIVVPTEGSFDVRFGRTSMTSERTLSAGRADTASSLGGFGAPGALALAVVVAGARATVARSVFG